MWRRCTEKFIVNVVGCRPVTGNAWASTNAYDKKDFFNAEANACQNELSHSSIEEARNIVRLKNLGKTEVEMNKLSAVSYVLAFENGRKMEEPEISMLNRIMPQINESALSMSITDLAVISASLHRAQISITDRRLMKALMKALSKCDDSSQGLRILKILDLSVRKSLPPESLPNDDELLTIVGSISNLLLSPKLPPLYGTRLLRFWQKLRISTKELDETTKYFLDGSLKVEDTDRPLKSWRMKDISQATFTSGFFARKWSKFSEAVLDEVQYRLSDESVYYRNEMKYFPDAYFQTMFGLLMQTGCNQIPRITQLVKENDLFSISPSDDVRGIEAWSSLLAACHLSSGPKENADFSQENSERLTGRQYMALQVADAARSAFPRCKVRITKLLPAFASEAKLDIVIEDIPMQRQSCVVSLLPLPELACIRHLSMLNNLVNKRQQLVSIYRPQGSELLRLRTIVSAGLVDIAVPILWPSWRTLREHNRNAFVKNIVLKAVSRR